MIAMVRCSPSGADILHFIVIQSRDSPVKVKRSKPTISNRRGSVFVDCLTDPTRLFICSLTCFYEESAAKTFEAELALPCFS